MNAFSLNWSRFRGYLFPPFNLILRCLAKERRDQANVVIICPVWPSQPWYPILLELSIDVPLWLLMSNNLLLSPTGNPHPLLETSSLTLAAWKLSGIISEAKAFQSQWSSFSWPVTDQTLLQRTDLHGTFGPLSTGWGSLVGIC